MACVAIASLSACSKPDHVSTLKFPVEGLTYTVETYDGEGPVSADFTRVYAHLIREGEADRQLVVDGEYLTIAGVVWAEPSTVILCIPEGITNSFRNEVTLRANGASMAVHTVLRERC